MVLQCKFEEIGLFIYATAILNPEGCKLASCAWVKSTASTSRGRIWCGGEENKTISSEYFRETEISDERESTACLGHCEKGWSPAGRAAGFSCWAASRRGRKDRCASGLGALCPVLAVQLLLVKEAPISEAQLINRFCQWRRVPRRVEALGRFCFLIQWNPLPMLLVLLSCFAIFILLPERSPSSSRGRCLWFTTESRCCQQRYLQLKRLVQWPPPSLGTPLQHEMERDGQIIWSLSPL